MQVAWVLHLVTAYLILFFVASTTALEFPIKIVSLTIITGLLKNV
jgi:hypothetical protein